MQNTPEYYNWLGYAFENVCYKHIYGIRKALSISPAAILIPGDMFPKKAAKIVAHKLIYCLIEKMVLSRCVKSNIPQNHL